jgi:hypothetical protein
MNEIAKPLDPSTLNNQQLNALYKRLIGKPAGRSKRKTKIKRILEKQSELSALQDLNNEPEQDIQGESNQVSVIDEGAQDAFTSQVTQPADFDRVLEKFIEQGKGFPKIAPPQIEQTVIPTRVTELLHTCAEWTLIGEIYHARHPQPQQLKGQLMSAGVRPYRIKLFVGGLSFDMKR